MRQMRPDRLLKLPQPILERAAAAVMRQRCRTIEFLLFPTGHEKKVVGQQIQLACLGIGVIDHDQQQPLCVLPRLGLVRTQFDDRLITFPGRTADRPRQVRSSQSLEHCITLDSP